MLDNIQYWLKGQPVQNFGDFLSAFFVERLFLELPTQASAIYLIGSALADFSVAPYVSDVLPSPEGPVVFWGCGLRSAESLTEALLPRCDILAVRGPLTRSALRLGDATPLGDPGLLLPLLHNQRLEGGRGTVLVPHFAERRSDETLKAISGCSRILRPDMANYTGAIVDFLNLLLAGDFVLCGSLHAAVACAAYGRPFAFWDSGAVDLPFAWEDFSASIEIPCEFQATAAQGLAHWERHIAPTLRLPALWPILAAAPFPVRPEIFMAAIAADVERRGASVLASIAPISIASRLAETRQTQCWSLTHTATEAYRASIAERDSAIERQEQLTRELQAAATTQRALKDELTVVNEDIHQISAERDLWQSRAVANLAEADRLNEALASQRQENAVLRKRVSAAQQATIDAEHRFSMIEQSTMWKATWPLRRIGQKYPKAARLGRLGLKAAWWAATLQLPTRLEMRRRSRATLAVSPASQASAFAQSEPASVGLDLRALFIEAHGRKPIDFPFAASPTVSIIIPAYKGLADVETCLRSIAVHMESEPSFEVIVVDDCPSEPVLAAIPDSAGLVKLANAVNLGFLLTCNRGADSARGRYLCFLNTDTIVEENWLRALVEAAEEVPGAALVGGMLLNRDGTIQDAGWRILGNGWGHSLGRNSDAADGAYTYRRAVDCVTGACFLISADTFRALGGLDPLYAPAFYEEFDLAFRIWRRGWKVIYEPRSRVVHLGSMSYGAERRDQLTTINHAKFCARFSDVLQKRDSDASDEFPLRHAIDSGPVLLVIDHGVPRPDRHAGDVTMSRYLALFATAGWRVVFGPRDGKADGPAAEAVERQGIELIRAPNTIENWLAEHGQHVRAVWIARPEIAGRLIGAIRGHAPAATVTYYTHDLHHLRLQREAELTGDRSLLLEAARMKALECHVFQSVDRVTSPSEIECQIVRDLVPGATAIALPPYYYEANEIRARDAAHFANRHDIVFVGGFPHTPNVDAALFIVTEIMPIVWRERPDARLMLVGYAPPPEITALAGERVVVTGQVPAVEPFLDAARVNLAALRYGAGVKGKVVQALQLGVPVVTTNVGAEGIGIVAGRDALVSEGAAALAEQVLSLFRDPQLCAALSHAGAALVTERFSRAAARSAIGRVFDQPRCSICGSGRLNAPDPDKNFSKAPVCLHCLATARTEALGRAAVARVARGGETSLAELARADVAIRIHEFGAAGAVAETLAGWENYSRSESLDGVATVGSGPSEARSKDLNHTTFDDDSFDLIVTNDVFDHVPEPGGRAFAEILRLLRPGGAHVFTVSRDRRPTDGARDWSSTAADSGTAVTMQVLEHPMQIVGGGSREIVWVYESTKPPVIAQADPQPPLGTGEHKT
jgi:GT2 family glycosyltransferase/glycosyltransferase involved in cell wall biosynthesis/SAM-dependent methyltransferase